MEAKDTIIEQPYDERSYDEGYKCGKEDGIKEVIDWINKNSIELIPYLEPATCVITSEWQTKLKKLGIES